MTSGVEARICEFKVSDGYPIKYRHWLPLGTPSQYVVALHGIQSHSGWFEFSSRRMAESGVEVLFLDRRGSGLNGRDRGHLAHQERAVNDVIQVLGAVRHRRDHEAPDAAIILLGLSWGGRVAAVVAAQRPRLVDGLVLLYPGICARIRPVWHERARLWLAARVGVRRKLVRVPLDHPALFTSNPDWQQFIRDDPLALRVVTNSFLTASERLRQSAIDSGPKIRCPTLLMLAGEDRIVDVPATYDWFSRWGTDQRTLIEFPEAQHTLEFESERETFVVRLIGWIQSVRRRSDPPQ